MRIEKNWFYKLSELFNLPFSKEIPEEDGIYKIFIEKDLTVMFFDDLNKNIDIEIWENSRVEFYSVLENTNDFNINFLQNKDFSNLKVRYLLLSKDNEKLKAKIYSKLSANNVKSDVHIISIVWTNWFVDLDWIIEIDKWVKKVDWNLLEENIFLWSTWTVKWIPTLLVRSNDVKASHACRMERISDEKLFYLRSRWIWKENAIFMLVESYVTDMFRCISMIDDVFYKELFEKIIKKVK